VRSDAKRSNLRSHHGRNVGVPQLPPLSPNARQAVGHHLEATLLELIDLSLFGKQLHWSVTGPLLPVLHERLDDLVDSWRALADKAAERAVAVGYRPDGQADALVAAPEHRAVARGPVEDVAVVSLLVQGLVPVIERRLAGADRPLRHWRCSSGLGTLLSYAVRYEHRWRAAREAPARCDERPRC
jgi:starvation-inducible DNA-binding protein